MIEPIAHTRLADDQQRTSWIDFDLLPQFAYQNTQILDIFGMTSPNLLYQLLMGHHEAGMGGQNTKKNILLACQLNTLPVQRYRP